MALSMATACGLKATLRVRALPSVLSQSHRLLHDRLRLRCRQNYVSDPVIHIRSTRACGFYKMSVLTKRALMTPLLSAVLPNHISSSDRMQRRNGLHAISPAVEPCITRFLHSVLAGFANGMPIKIRVMPDCIVSPTTLVNCTASPRN
jgi:hypothetical protein